MSNSKKSKIPRIRGKVKGADWSESVHDNTLSVFHRGRQERIDRFFVSHQN